MTGRPSVYTPEIADEICERLAAGESLLAICRDEHMPARSTVNAWKADDTDGFSAKYAHAREAQYERWADELIEISDDSRNDWMLRQTRDGDTEEVPNREAIQRSALRVDTRKWLLSKLLPKKYGAKVEVEHGGKIKVEDERREHVAATLGELFRPELDSVSDGPDRALGGATDDAGGSEPLVSDDAQPGGGNRKRRAR